MKTACWTRKQFCQLAGASAIWLAAFIATASAQQGTNSPAAPQQTNAPPKTADAGGSSDADAEDLNNWVTLGVGGSAVSGDRAQYQKQSGLPGSTAYGGVESFHYELPVAKKGVFQVDGRGIFDNHDYDLKLDLEHPDVGYIRGGIRQYRVYYDGTGGYYPAGNLSFEPPNTDLFLDRGTAFIEAALMLPNWPEVKLRYEHDFRSGSKDSTEWGTTTLTVAAAQKKIGPAYMLLNEKTDTISADVKDTIRDMDVGLGIRYDWIRNVDSQNIEFFPNQNNATGASHTTSQLEGYRNDMFNAHGFTDTTLNDKLEFTTGGAYTSMQDEIFGNRLDNPVVATGASTRFANLAGISDLEEYEAMANLSYTPCDNIYIVPAARVDKQDLAGNSVDNTVTGNNVIGALNSNTNTETRLDIAESLDARYTGLTNWVFYIRCDWEENQAGLNEFAYSPTPTTSLTNDWHQMLQKYTVGVNWYPLRNLNFSAQYYHQLDENNYENVTLNVGYVGFIQQENFITDDANFRATWHPCAPVMLVTRYDYMNSTVYMQGTGLAMEQSGNNNTQMIGETLSLTPCARMYLQFGANYVIDTTRTPAELWPATTGVILKSQNDYWTTDLTIGYGIDDKTRVSATYVYYRASDYTDNSAAGLPYGAGGEQHNISATLQRQITSRLRWALTYSFVNYRDDLFGGQIDYTAHSILSSVQYRF